MSVQDEVRVDDLLQSGWDALRGGDQAAASVQFRKAAELSPYDERVWKALLNVVSEPDDERVCLENILAINPGNVKAKKRLAALDGPPPTVEAPPPAAPPAPTPVEIQAAAEQNYARQEAKQRGRQRRWRAFRSGFGQGLLVSFAGILIGMVLSVFLYGFGLNGGMLDPLLAPIRAALNP